MVGSDENRQSVRLSVRPTVTEGLTGTGGEGSPSRTCPEPTTVVRLGHRYLDDLQLLNQSSTPVILSSKSLPL